MTRDKANQAPIPSTQLLRRRLKSRSKIQFHRSSKHWPRNALWATRGSNLCLRGQSNARDNSMDLIDAIWFAKELPIESPLVSHLWLERLVFHANRHVSSVSISINQYRETNNSTANWSSVYGMPLNEGRSTVSEFGTRENKSTTVFCISSNDTKESQPRRQTNNRRLERTQRRIKEAE